MGDRVRKPVEEILTEDKPILQRVEAVEVEADDILIGCAGFEDRAAEVILKRLSSNVRRAVVVDYRPAILSNRLEEVTSQCQKRGIPHQVLRYDRQDPAGFGEVLTTACRGCTGRILVDVSGMSRLLIVQSLVALADVRELSSRVTVLYCEAAEYPPSRTAVESAYLNESPIGFQINPTVMLSSGVFDVIAVPELSSVALGGQPIRLIAFPSFNTDQLTALVSEIQSSAVTLVHGVPPHESNSWRTSAIRRINCVDDLQPKQELYCDTLNYLDTLTRLLELYAEFGGFQRLIVSPTGSKMQAVAVGLFRALVRDVQIVYPTPRAFVLPKAYTRGVKQLFSLCLGDPLSRAWRA